MENVAHETTVGKGALEWRPMGREREREETYENPGFIAACTTAAGSDKSSGS